MDERTLESIKNFLHREDVQERIQQNIQHGRSQITVPIGGAVDLFHFSENQLRKWEEKGLLEPKRDGRHRHYTLRDLDKLAIIRVLIDAKYSPSDIPPNIDSIWFSMAPSDGQQGQGEQFKQPIVSSGSKDDLPINVRIENAREELFWRYFASHALRLSLMLICEDISGTPAGLVLPLGPNPATPVRRVEDLWQAGESLVGWLSKSRSSHTLFTSVPSFQYSTDYSVLPLAVMKDDKPLEEPQDKTLIVLDRLDRRSKSLSLRPAVVETIRLLLAPLYENAQTLRSDFGPGMRDGLEPAPDLGNTTYADFILNGLANMVVHLGGQTSDGRDRWRFACILLPQDYLLPVQQRTLIVRAQSQLSPHKVGGTAVSPDKSVNSLSLRAYQSGHVIYRSQIFDSDTSVAYHEVEGPVRSALAIPIGGENGAAIGVVYVTSYETEAFPENLQRVLRMVGRIVEEAILTYSVRNRVTGRLAHSIAHPLSVDPLFEDFLSENDFVHDVEKLLNMLKAQLGEWKEPKPREEVLLDERKRQYREQELSGGSVSFIAVDIDNQSSLATKYGDQVARNLSKAVGLRIQGQQRLYSNPEHRQLYHIYADRFYFLLKGMVLDEARNKAEQLRMALEGDYLIEARRTPAERLMLPERKLDLSKVTVRIGVSSYTYGKLKELLQRYPYETAVADIRALIVHFPLDGALDLGREEGGNVVIAWDPEIWGLARWSPPSKAD